MPKIIIAFDEFWKSGENGGPDWPCIRNYNTENLNLHQWSAIGSIGAGIQDPEIENTIPTLSVRRKSLKRARSPSYPLLRNHSTGSERSSEAQPYTKKPRQQPVKSNLLAPINKGVISLLE